MNLGVYLINSLSAIHPISVRISFLHSYLYSDEAQLL